MSEATTWEEFAQLPLVDRELKLAERAFSKTVSPALNESDESAFRLIFEALSDTTFVASQRATLGWVKRHWQLERCVEDAIAGWDLHCRRWLVRLAQVPAAAAALQALEKKTRGKENEVVSFALASAGHIEWPSSVLRRVVISYLNAVPGRFAFAGLVPLAVLAKGTRLCLLEQPRPVLQWPQIEALLPEADAKLRALLAVNYCGQDFRARAIGLLKEDAKASVECLWAWQNSYALSPEGQIVTALFLCTEAPSRLTKQLPPTVGTGLLLDLCSGSDGDAEYSRAALAALPLEQARRLVRDNLRERRALALLGPVVDDELVQEVLSRLGRGGMELQAATDALSACGQVAASVIVQGGEAGAPASVVRAAAVCLIRYPSKEACGLLVQWLGHSSNVAAAAACRALETLADGDHWDLVSEALSEGLAESRKREREAAERLLATLTTRRALKTTPLDRVRELASQAPEVDRVTFLQLCEELNNSEQKWAIALRPVVMKRGAVALHWLRPWFERQIVNGQTRLWCYVVECLACDAASVWVAVDSFARLPKLPTVLWARPRHALAKAGVLLALPIAHVLQQVSSEHLEPLFRLLAKHAQLEALDVLLAGLSHSNKMVRAHCVDGLSRLKDTPTDEVIKLLQVGNIGTRISAAELLAIWSKREAEPVLVAALAREKSFKVKPYIEDAWVALGAAKKFLGGDASIEGQLSAVRALFETQRLPKTSAPFLQHETLPVLLLSDGAPLTERAQRGFLARVMLLDATLKGRVLRELKCHFEAKSLLQWSRRVHQCWTRAKDSRHKWAVLQLWLFADATTIDQVGYAIGKLKPTEHVAVSAYLKVLQWHPSGVSKDWLLYWAENLRSRGVREQARELAQRVAFKQGLPLAALRKKAAAHIGERHLDLELAEAPADARLRYQFIRHFERAWRQNYAWTKGVLVLLAQRFPEVVESVLLQTEDGTLVSRRAGRWSTSRVRSDARLVLAHPLHTAAAPLKEWQSSHGEALIQQAERRIFVAGSDTDLELSLLDTNSERLDEWRRAEGWLHGEPLDQGVVHANFLRLPGAGVVTELRHSGYPIGNHEWTEDVHMLEVRFADLDGNELEAEAVPPLVYSEICRSLSLLVLPQNSA